MKTLVGIVALAGLAGAASGEVILRGGNGPLAGTVQAFTVPDSYQGDGLRVVNTNYDNWTNPPSALTGVFLAGGDEIADDLSMVAVGAGWLSNMGINVANANGTSNLTGGQMIIRFYDGGGSFIGGFAANLPALSLAAGASARLQFADGALSGLNIFLPTNIFVSLQINTSTWSGAGSNANIGYQTRGPIGVGSSTDGMINVTTNTPFNFNGNPVANTGLYIRTDNVPAPGALALLGLGGLLAARRRR
jgi:MYXO-CTERM domain-containing protein